MANKVPVAEKSKERSYYKYYLQDMAPIPVEKQEFLKNPKGNPEDALKIEDRNKLFDPGYLSDEKGYFMLDNGTAVVSNNTFFKGSKGEMLQWWFAWHGVDPLRYAIWDPFDHYGLEINDEARAKMTDPDVSIADKCYDVDHLVTESLVMGEEPTKLLIGFKNPASMGYDTSKIFTDACSFLVCANVWIDGPDGSKAPVVMTHMARDIEGGCELRSRFWLGYQIIDGKAKKMIPDGMVFPEIIVSNLLGHNFAEFTNLAAILPSVYAEEKDNWA